ncbi:MAG: hypothetical protein AAGA85_20360 [Bacteroidota bacterium]
MTKASSVLAYLLLLVNIGMTLWGVLGFLEYLTGFALIPLQNPNFPSGTQFMHWLTITASGLIYLLGFITRWRYTPYAMIVSYAMLGTLCTVETFDFMTAEWRYRSYINEIMLYLLLSWYFLQSGFVKRYFSGRSAGAPDPPSAAI